MHYYPNTHTLYLIYHWLRTCFLY